MELKLHARVLQGESLASEDVFRVLMDPIVKVLKHEVGCQVDDDAYDSAVDAVLYYLRHPQRYDSQRARLSTYLTQIAKRRAADRHRSGKSRVQREEDYGEEFALRASAPKDVMELSVEARLTVRKLEQINFRTEERKLLGPVLQGEGATEELGKVLGLDSLSELEQRREVKRHRDRLMKRLARVGKEDAHDKS
ncbi:RNA polymerase sigma factor [Corallococcus macrosporus]|uniref:Putative RNA polymerase sigma-70 factor n=1 Tax=Myxococcus fulvus (strain ATCC BAA-855 / HW-1) TaxID=483219 RepID=F8CQV0_MYXFH|nr:sigma factor [Corallococcus macrosporus]AEI68014.1 putative RNA polymerase sigma-70 factor [Corallococcus macrosporus]